MSSEGFLCGPFAVTGYVCYGQCVAPEERVFGGGDSYFTHGLCLLPLCSCYCVPSVKMTLIAVVHRSVHRV
jgi:hypothetical protein